MKYEQIDNLIAKKICGEASQSELAIIEQWRKLSAENEVLYSEYALLWDESAKYESNDFQPNYEPALASHIKMLEDEISSTNITSENVTTDSTIIDIEVKKETSTSIISIKRISSIAAIFVLGLAALFLFKNNTTEILSNDGIQYVSLEDGSLIWLDEGSSISYENGFGTKHRNITLEGKAFFDVSKNENLPFTITEEDMTISVLGTSFTIDGSSDQVSVNTGKVAISSGSDEITLVMNQKASLTREGFKTSHYAKIKDHWRNPNLSFDSAPIAHVVADINLFHNDQVILDTGSDLSQCLFTSGGMSLESLDNIIKILETSFDLKVSKLEGGEIKLKIIDCE